MCPLSMPFAGICIKESNGAEGTKQYHTHMGMVHMRAYSGMGDEDTSGTPQPGSGRPTWCHLHWHIRVPFQWVYWVPWVGGLVRRGLLL